jgi:tetratricopeptide (TPR) repeat protein
MMYAVASILFICIATVSCSSDKKANTAVSFYELKERKPVLASTREWGDVKKRYEQLQLNLQKKPSDIRSQIALVSLYINEGRVTGDFDYYNAAAMTGIKKILDIDPDHFEALTFQSTIQLSEHQFEAALKTADKVKSLYPYNAYVYGLITDAQVELGNYEAAINAAEQMISLRPDIRSYSRIAYIREIHGDLNGAVEAMQLAVDAGAPGEESTAWCRFQLGRLFEHLDDWKSAEEQYQLALKFRENYAPAINGMGNVAMEHKNYKNAIAFYSKADAIVSDHSSMEGLAAAYEATGEKNLAASVRKEIFLKMKNYSGDGLRPKTEGQNEDHEMAHACIGIGDLQTALKYALVEQKRRPGNIEVNETVATIYAKMQKYEEALPFIKTALSTKSRNPELLEQAAEIFSKTGHTEDARIAMQNLITVHQ